jgi:hypothetical protein
MATAQPIQVQAVVRAAWWRRLSPASLALAGLTALILWAAVATLLGQGRLGTVLGAGRAELAAPLLVALVVVTGICEQIWPARPRGDPVHDAAQRRRGLADQ